MALTKATYSMISGAPVNVLDFGADPTGTNDSTAAIQAAFDSGAGRIYFPKGTYNYTILNFDSAVGNVFYGDGAIGKSILRCTSTGTSNGIKVRSTFDVTFENITFDHSSASFLGYLVDARHKPTTSVDTQGLYFSRCTFASKDYNLYSAHGINLDQSSGSTFIGCKFLSLFHPIDGQAAAGSSYANVVRIISCQFADNVEYALNYLGQGWTIIGCNFQACQDGKQRIAYSATGLTPFQNVIFTNCTVYDALSGGTSYLNLGSGSNLTIDGGLWGGLSGSNLIDATGAIVGLTIKNAWLSLFSNIAVASVSGQKAWNINDGNYIVGSTPTLVVNPSNVAGLITNGNFPSQARGTFAVNGVRYNDDGTIEMWGTAINVVSGSLQTITFPVAFTTCYNIQTTLYSPAVTTNVVSIGTYSASSFTVYIQGTGNSNVMWHAIGV